MIGQTISHYRVLEKLGEGGMGTVYKAQDTNLNRTVALKFLSPQALSAPEGRARFVTEARAAAALDHPNICSVHEIGEADGHTFIAMQYVDGESLGEKIKRGPMRIEETLRLGIEIARGLQEAHENNVIHRDIKSANIMVTGKGQAKITDFGLAKLSGGTKLTKTGTMLGTAAYMSPEQLAGETLDHRSDIWSLGVVLYEMLTARLPFGGEHEHAVAYQVMHEIPEAISGVRTGVPLELERIVSKCLAKSPADRYQHADELAVDLRNAGVKPAAAKGRRGRLAFWIPAAGIVLAAILYLIIGGTHRPKVEPDFENPLAGASFRRLTDVEGWRDATISPDGKFVAFVSDHDGEFDIWITQVETGNTYNRTRGQLGDMRRGLQDVGFSGSGSEVLSFSLKNTQPILSMPLLEGPPRRILRDSVIMAFWSPDGRYVAYFTDSEGDPVFVADADGTNSRAILTSEPGMHQHYQQWSPDGSWIYMTRGREGGYRSDLWRVRPDGSGLEQLTEDQIEVSYPTPVTDRMVLFIARDADGEGPSIWGIDVESRIVRKVSIGPESYSSLSASMNGRRLVTSVIRPESNLLDLWSVPILDSLATESDVSQVTQRGQRAQVPRFGGSALFYLSMRPTGDGLWCRTGDQVREVWDAAPYPLSEAPAISPDGRSIAVVLLQEGRSRLHLINSDGSNLRLLSDSVEARGTSCFSPDGKWIVTGGYASGRQGLFKMSVEDGHFERLVEGEALHPVWSPAGDLIVYAAKQTSGLTPLEGIRPDGRPAELPDIEVWVGGERFRFLPDGSGLVYMRGWFAGENFYLLDLATLESRQLTELAKGKGPTIRTFDIAPDGKSIVFDRMRIKTEIVLIERPNEPDPE